MPKDAAPGQIPFSCPEQDRQQPYGRYDRFCGCCHRRGGSEVISSKRGGILLIVLGIAICVCLIVCQYWHCVDMWYSDKTMLFDSVMDYFFEVSTGAILVSVLLGSIPVITGISLLLKKN